MPTLREFDARIHPIFLTYKWCCCASLWAIGLPFFILININPSFSIQNVYVPAVNKFINPISIPNTTGDHDSSFIFFDLEVQNEMDNKGVYYDAMNLTFSYATNTTSNMAIGSYTVGGFYQGWKKKAQRRDVAAVTCSLPWEAEAMRALSAGVKAEFRVDLVTRVKFKNFFWCSKKKTVAVGGVVEVDDSGKKVGKKSVELKSGGRPPSGLLVLLSVAGFLVVIAVVPFMVGFAVANCVSSLYSRN